MSDDTPTERFDPTPDGEKRRDGATPPEDTATQRMPVQGAGDDATPVQGTPVQGTPVQGTPIEDVPTEAFDAAKSAQTPGDNAPTERFVPITGASSHPAPVFDPTNGGAWPPVEPATRILPTAAAAGAGAGAGGIPPGRAHTLAQPAEGERKSRALLFWLIGIGAALLITVIVLLAMFFTGQDDTPVAAPTPSATATQPAAPSEEPTPTEEPSQSATPTPTPTEEPAAAPTFSSFEAPTSAGCEEGDDNAPLTISWASRDATTASIGVNTDDASRDPFEADLPPVFTYTGLNYECELPSQVYTVTLENADGLTTSQSVTIRP
jgi:hypothetical protein